MQFDPVTVAFEDPLLPLQERPKTNEFILDFTLPFQSSN